jgi:hypothetical protein
MYVETKRNIQAFGSNHLIYSVIVAFIGEDKTIFISVDINNPEVEVH